MLRIISLTSLFIGLGLFFPLCTANPPAPAIDRTASIPIKSLLANATPTLTPVQGPGLVVVGKVNLSSGIGLEGVKIYRAYASYPGVLIATTDALGEYSSVMMPIPGDEMVRVWAEYPGYKFSPEYYAWRHYYGYEEVTCDFVAFTPVRQYLPMIR